MAETHPLDEQNAIERKIQLEGPQDPENFRMPDGRTLADVRRDLYDKHTKEFKEDDNALRAHSRKLSRPEFSKGGKLVMTSAGNIIDVTEPKKVEKTEQTTPQPPPETLPPPPTE